MTNRITLIFLLTVFVFNLATRRVHAYLDPGTGSYILQLLIGGAVGGLFILKTYWFALKDRITSFISRFRNPRPKENHDGS